VPFEDEPAVPTTSNNAQVQTTVKLLIYEKAVFIFIASSGFCVRANASAQSIPGMQGKASQRYSSGFGFANSTFAKLKVQKGDVIQSVNGIPTIKMDDYVAAAGPIRANDKIKVVFLRGQKSATTQTKAIMKPYETSATVDIIYDWVKFRDGYLRTITRKPKNKTNLPCILLIPVTAAAASTITPKATTANSWTNGSKRLRRSDDRKIGTWRQFWLPTLR
jgi:hypothetical protein